MLPFNEEQKSLNRGALDDETLLSGQFWGELRTFLAVAKTKSFNRAAEITNTSQPTVSRQVKRLQDVVGSQLFISTPRGVKLTEKGEALAKALSRLDHTLFSITSDLRAESREAEGIVRASITDGLKRTFRAPVSYDFPSSIQEFSCTLKTPLNMMSLRENQTDMMISFTPSSSSDIQFRRLGQLHFLPSRFEGLHQAVWIADARQPRTTLFLQSHYYLAKTGLWDGWQQTVARGRIMHYCDNSFAYGMLVKAGLGIGMLPSYVLVEPDLVPLEIDLRISVPTLPHCTHGAP